MSKKAKKTQNKKNKDAIEVLVIFAVLVLVVITMTLCGRGDYEIDDMKKNTKQEQRREDTGGEMAIMATAGVAVVIIVCFVVKKSNDARKRREAIKLHNQRLEDERRLAEAKERVRQARLQEMIDAGINQLTDKRGRTNRYARGRDEDYRLRDNEFDSFDINDNRLESYYRNRQMSGLYDDYDELSDEDYDEMPDTFLGKVKYRLEQINSYWWVLAIVAAVAVIGGLFIAFNVL